MVLNKRKNKLQFISPYIAAAVILTVLWWVLSLLINRPALPPPHKAILELFNQVFNHGLFYHGWVSFYRVGISILLAFFLGMPLGIFLGKNKKIDAYVSPIIYLTYPIPKVVLLPVLLVLLGYGDVSKIFLITLIVFFQILVTTRDAARGIDPAIVMSVKSLGAGRRHLYWHVYFQGCLPEILTALRIALGTSIAVLFIAEAYATQEGLGYFIMDAMGRIDYSRMFAGIIAMAILGFILYLVLDLTEKTFCRWKNLEK